MFIYIFLKKSYYSFWDHSKLQTFWKRIKKELEKNLQIDLPMDSLPVFIRCDSYSSVYYRTMLYIWIFNVLLMIMRKFITINLLKPDPPLIAYWLYVHMMEYVTE